jgi:hypothetical protein
VNIHGINDVKQTEIHATDSEPHASEGEMAIKKLIIYNKSPGKNLF